MSKEDIERQYSQFFNHIWDRVAKEVSDKIIREILGLKETDELPEISPRGKSFVDRIMKAARKNND